MACQSASVTGTRGDAGGKAVEKDNGDAGLEGLALDDGREFTGESAGRLGGSLGER